MIYKNYQRNHVILPGREDALAAFLEQDYRGMKHKMRNAVSSHSEDALTWSCFDTLRSLPGLDRAAALDEILEDSFQGASPLSFREKGIGSDDIAIHIGKTYTGASINESTEVDVSVEAPGVPLFFEAKLYSAVSPATPLKKKPHDQIARKLRVGLDSALGRERDLYFAFLDLAPVKMTYQRRPKSEAVGRPGGGFRDKWRSAWLFQYYSRSRNQNLRPLTQALAGVDHPPVDQIAARMGWLTWADLFKCTMRAALPLIPPPSKGERG